MQMSELNALDLADMGYKVYLVEQGPSIGGVMAQLDKTFPTKPNEKAQIRETRAR